MPYPTRRRFGVHTLSLALAGASPGLWAQPNAASPRRIVLGQSVPLTGAAAEVGLAFAAGAKLGVDAFNARKPSPGFSFELRQLDDGYDPARAEANARKLLAEGADLLFGFVGTGSSDAAARVAKAEGTLLFAPFAASDELRDAKHPEVFHVRPSLSDEAFKIVRHAVTLGQTRIAVVGEADAMGRAGQAAVAQALDELKQPAAVAVQTVPVNSPQVDAAVAALMKAQPQAVVLVSLFNASAAVIRKMRAAGFRGTFMCFSVVGLDPLFTALGPDIGGVVVSQVVPSPYNPARPVSREFVAAAKQQGRMQANFSSMEGYLAAKLFTEGLKRAGGKPTREALIAALESINEDFGGYRVSFGPGNHVASKFVELSMLTGDGRVRT